MRIIVKNLPESAKKEEIEAHFNKKGNVTDVFMLVNNKGIFRKVCFIGFKMEQEATDSQIYFNNTYFKNHKISVEMAKDERLDNVEKNETQLRKALYSKTIVIKNLSNEISEEHLVETLEKIGRVVDIKYETRNDCRVAIIKFKEGEHAEEALKTIKVIGGCRVKIGNFREKIIDSKNEYYNSLFFNFDTVIRRTCEIEKISREDLVNLRDKDLGSRIAMLESNLVDQTKQFLRHNSIFLDGIQQEKSKTVVILRNADLLGALDRIKGEFKIKMAPSKCLALLEFNDPKEAEKCYREMNMKRFKNQVVYCEFVPICKAPECLPVDPVNTTDNKKKSSNKIVVKNVPFQATQEELKKLFSSYIHVLEVRLPKKVDGMHRGFGFIVLDSSDNADKAIEYFGNSTHLYGRRLVLEKAKS